MPEINCKGCGGPVHPKDIYRLPGATVVDDYCSRKCVMEAHAKRFPNLKEDTVESEKPMLRPAKDFGDSGVVRRFCDNCNAPITLCWKNRNGEFCSRECQQLFETDLKNNKENSMTETNTATTDEKPITAGAASGKKKKKSKKAKAAKAVTAAAAAPKSTGKAKAAEASSNGKASRIPDETVISVKSTDHEFKGFRADALNLMKDGMTVGKYRAALEKKGGRMPTYAPWALKTAVDNKLIALK